jgi:hypothetical protein
VLAAHQQIKAIIIARKARPWESTSSSSSSRSKKIL